jgi:hypothetical protein
MRQSNNRRWLSVAPLLAALCFVPACGGATDGDTNGTSADSLKGDGSDKDAGSPANATAEAQPCPYPGVDPKDPKGGGEPWDPNAGGEPPKAGGGVWYGKDDGKGGAVNVVWISKEDVEANEKGEIAVGEPYPGKPGAEPYPPKPGDPNGGGVIIGYPGKPGDPNGPVIISKSGPDKPGAGSGVFIGKPGYPDKPGAGKPYPNDPCATPVKPPPPVLEPCGDDKVPPKK